MKTLALKGKPEVLVTVHNNVATRTNNPKTNEVITPKDKGSSNEGIAEIAFVHLLCTNCKKGEGCQFFENINEFKEIADKIIKDFEQSDDPPLELKWNCKICF
jgi:hypothetical protein